MSALTDRIRARGHWEVSDYLDSCEIAPNAVDAVKDDHDYDPADYECDCGYDDALAAADILDALEEQAQPGAYIDSVALQGQLRATAVDFADTPMSKLLTDAADALFAWQLAYTVLNVASRRSEA